jgi:tRNA pseudouridine13 synthase
MFYTAGAYPKVTVINRQFSLDFPFAYGPPEASAQFRTELEDFRVDELLGFDFSGQGEHLCLHIEKRDENTRWIARLLAEYFEVDEMAIGYCGLKDRRAVTRQWFSVHLPGKSAQDKTDVHISQMGGSDGPGYKVLAVDRHHQKLRRGMHRANGFAIRLRQVQGDREALEARLQQISTRGVPNYFGEQRFGHDGGNLTEADNLLRTQYGADRKPDERSMGLGKRDLGKRSLGKKDSGKKKGRGKRGSPRGGLYLSAARSYLFNQVLAEHVRQGSWLNTIDGVATGPMWGRGRLNAPEPVCQFEQSVLSDWQDWTHALEFSGLQQERRALVLYPEELDWHWLSSTGAEHADLVLSFTLPSGCFATSVLREIARLESVTPGFVAAAPSELS